MATVFTGDAKQSAVMQQYVVRPSGRLSGTFRYHDDGIFMGYFYEGFYCLIHKIPVGATWGPRPHNFLAMGAIAPVESTPMPETIA